MFTTGPAGSGDLEKLKIFEEENQGDKGKEGFFRTKYLIIKP